ncbi:MAG: hypothetical protein WCY59_04245 [Anaerovoracaceae bacterium]|jgi:hypothetical protein|nr:hypothetical protein [Candidatus Hydrogenedens sp.]
MRHAFSQSEDKPRDKAEFVFVLGVGNRRESIEMLNFRAGTSAIFMGGIHVKARADKSSFPKSRQKRKRPEKY